MSPGSEETQNVVLSFRDVRFGVDVSRTRAFFTGGVVTHKRILKDVSGVVESGQILAIIGSSGAGKTSLLDILVGKVRSSKELTITGDITVNGQPMSRLFFLENAAYVPQEDRLWSALTAYCRDCYPIMKNITLLLAAVCESGIVHVLDYRGYWYPYDMGLRMMGSAGMPFANFLYTMQKNAIP